MVNRVDLCKAVSAEPTLCEEGMASMHVRNYRTEGLTGENFDKSRAELLNKVDQFSRAVDFLAQCKLRQTPNHSRIGGSYYLKHAAERWSGSYISNGALIAAVIHLGIPYKVYDDSLNIKVAVSSKCPLASERKSADVA